MATERDKAYTRTLSPSRRYPKSPGDRTGVSLHQAMLEWPVTQHRLYQLEHDGELVGIHVGNRVWYSRAQLTELLGEPRFPTPPPALKRRDNRERTTGGQQQGFEFASQPVAA